jgi:hypothetical protein
MMLGWYVSVGRGGSCPATSTATFYLSIVTNIYLCSPRTPVITDHEAAVILTELVLRNILSNVNNSQ